jgi:ribonuclease HIII
MHLMPAPVHSHTVPLTGEQAAKLQELLRGRGFEFLEKPYTIFAARKDKLNVTVYEKGPKVLVQGKGLEDFISFVLEPEILGVATFGYEEELQPERFAPHFGIDETGKGDFFGPLVVAGVYVDGDLARTFRDLGITDSKRITSDARIRSLAAAIRKTRAPSTIILINPARYNELIVKFGNVNRLLAWGHARAIENLCEQVPSCPSALSDQFANPAVLRRALQARGRQLELRQQTKAESDPAVAAASILAREALVDWWEKTAKEDGEAEPYPRGASAKVKQRAVELVRARGADFLPRVVKMHFKTAAEVLAEAGN